LREIHANDVGDCEISRVLIDGTRAGFIPGIAQRLNGRRSSMPILDDLVTVELRDLHVVLVIDAEPGRIILIRERPDELPIWKGIDVDVVRGRIGDVD
jgi:hypothetical protein